MNRHEPWDELVSASLTGDLSADERRRLDAHLDTCAECRSTLAAFADQRRILAGLRHLPVPRDLGARVRTGIEGGSRVGLPWWRRPATIFAGVGGGLAVVAGALLAIVLLNGSPDGPRVGESSPTPSDSVVAESASPIPSVPPPSASPAESASAPSSDATPSVAPITASPEPDVYLALTGPFDNQALTVRHGPTGETIAEIDTPSGPPIAAELSPDGQWLAYITQLGESGLNEVRATRIAQGIPSDDPEALPPVSSPVVVGETVILGESVAGSPFLEHLAWASNSQYLTFTLADPEANATDVWLFQPSIAQPQQITNVGNAYAGSWVPSSGGSSLLWVSTASDVPMSYLLGFHDSAGANLGPGDPADDPTAVANGVFQPLLSPNGSLAIYWTGRMEPSGAEWVFIEGGQPYLSEHSEGFEFTDERELFSDLTIGRDAFTSAAIAWGSDGDAYAVWDAMWTGIPQGSGGEYPNVNRVYFGHATDPRGLTESHAIDEGDVPEGATIVDVKVSPTGEHLVISAARPRGGVLEAPAADLLLVRRNTGDVADEVFVIGSADNGWFGPADFDAISEAEAP
ncbi:MAG: anti-sigma factor [Candidatus Limnocylindria bacterium]